MKQLEIIVNKREHLSLSINSSSTVEQLINKIIQTLQFPKESKYTITIDGTPIDSSYQIPENLQSRIIADFNCLTSIQFENPFIQTTEQELDLCKPLVEIQKELAKVMLPIEYQIIILKNGKRLTETYINYYPEIPKKLQFIVKASIYINYQGIHHQLQLNPFEKIEKIKNYIFQQLNIDQGFLLFYNNTQLNDEMYFISYLIPDHSELTIKLQTRITLLVKYQNIVHKYSTSLNEKLSVVKTKLKQTYKIPENEKLELFYQNIYLDNNEEKLSALNIEDNSLINITIGKKYNLNLENDYQQQTYQCQVNSIDLVSILDDIIPLQNCQLTYYFGGKELDKNRSFDQIQVNNCNINIKYRVQKKTIFVNFQEEQKSSIKLEVNISDPIRLALPHINLANDSITMFFQGRKISIESTYDQEGIKEGSTIIYQFNQFQIKYTIAPDFQEYSILIAPRINGAQLINILSKNYKGLSKKFKLMLNNIEFPVSQIVEKQENQCFRLVSMFEMQFQFQNDNHIYNKTYSMDDTILIARQRFSEEFNIPLNQLYIFFLDQELKDEYMIHKYKGKDLQICETICVKFQKYKSNVLIQKNCNKNFQVKEILKEFLREFSQKGCRCFLNNQLINELNLLKEITNQPAVLLVVEFQQELQLINKQIKTQAIQVEFYPKQIVASTLARFMNGNFQFYQNDELIDATKSFEDNHIQNKSQIYYEECYNFTLEILNDNQQIQLRINSQKIKIKDAIQQKIQEKYSSQFSAFYNKQEINLENTFLQEKLMDQSKIQIQLHQQLKVFIKDNDYKIQFTVSSNITVGELIKQLKGSKQKKLFNAENQKQLQDHEVLFTLINSNKVVDLIYKEPIENSNSLYIPSEPIQNNRKITLDINTQEPVPLQIVIYNMMDDHKLYETVRLDQKVGEFLDQFEKKMEFSGVTLFYDGEIVDRNKKFQEINLNALSIFEIVC
ncbi:unnamed protein product [Paramecium sonneborni]|uniref:Ubiquitin-like domain-containing protein n=1 Tax=Paramecium sonneborni TaxID=65129 RepID=A0A8S1R464_9CILI|nr:unnamed protein product [Paramecium sonneborni]